MVIVFICGSLEEGRDGVGDYTRRLASELITNRHSAHIIAINDRYVKEPYNGHQISASNNVPVFRLPSLLSAEVRFSNARKTIQALNPQWISVQFVIYSFDAQGIPFGISRKLKSLGSNCLWHFMFHELWIGVEKGRFLKNWIIGKLQKGIIKRIIRYIRPALIHTHLPEFRTNLQDMGWKVNTLPLFSNIDVIDDTTCKTADNIIRIGFFSQAKISRRMIAFFRDFKNDALNYNYTLELIFIGGRIEKMQELGSCLETLGIFRKSVEYTGFLQPTEISLVIHSCNMGITSVPRHAVGKSGSVAAFLAHGIPVAAPDIHPGYSADEIGIDSTLLRSSVILEPKLGCINQAAEVLVKAKSEIFVSTVCSKFLSALSNYGRS